MKAPDFKQVKEIFFAASALPGADRAAFLDRACGADADLRREVESLLSAGADTRALLGDDAGSVDRAILFERPGTVIGRYKLLEQIGEGGFGVVFMAEQEQPVRRRVALKVIKLGMDTKQVVARFEAERQALAMMDHPNIAKVLDAGSTDTGRPYFVMELVKGIPITSYCDEHKLSTTARLGLFLSVCGAVQHAHQKGIIHRDIKPSNVLVTLLDDRPVAKVIDFGVAKATQSKLTEKTLFTGFRQMIGTPVYMSPEQAQMSALDVDTRSDIYSLGVLLYELLTGTTPFDGKQLLSAAYEEMQRIIREVEPPQPSTRLSTLAPDTQIANASRRQSDPKHLTQQMRGDLDWIVMRCLEKDRQRRYDSASALAQDIERHLSDQPVEACGPSKVYRLKKFARRNRSAIATGIAIAVIMVLATAISSWQAVRATRAKTVVVAEKLRADQAAATAASVAGYLQQMLASTGRTDGNGNSYSARQMLDDFADSLGTKLDNQPDVEAPVQETVGRIYRNLGDGDHAVQHFQRLLTLRSQVYGKQHELYADALVDLADGLRAQSWQGPQEDAARLQVEAALREALEIYRSRGVSAERILDVLYGLASNLWAEGKFSEIEPVAEQGMAIARQLPDDPRTADWYIELGQQNVIRGHYAEAEALYRQGLEVNRRLRGPEDIQTAWACVFLGGASLMGQHKYAEALAFRRQALEIFRLRCPANHRNIGNALWAILQNMNAAHGGSALSQVFPTTDKLAEVEALYRPSLATTPVRRALNPAIEAAQDLGLFAGIYLDLAQEYSAAGNSREAQAARQKADDLLANLPGDCRGDPALLMAAYPALIVAAMRIDRPDEASAMRHKLAELDPKNAIGDPLNHSAWFLVSPAHPTGDRIAVGIEFAEKAVAMSPDDGDFWNTLGVARYRAGEWRKAIESLQKSRELQKYRTLSEDSFFLAMSYWQLGERDQARTWYDRGQAWMQNNLPRNPQLLAFRDEARRLLMIHDPATLPATQPLLH